MPAREKQEIQRFDPQMRDTPDGPVPSYVPASNGILVRYEDHLAALQEATVQKELAIAQAAENAVRCNELTTERDRLQAGLKAEVEHYRESAAQHRDRAATCKYAVDGEEQIRRGLEDDTRADRLERLLGEAS